MRELFTIIFTLGQVIYQQSNFIDNESTVDLSSFVNGIYLLKISNQENITLSQKIIKN